jgi:hypothetical protein
MFIELTFSSSQEKNQEKENVKRREARCRANAMFPLFLALFFYNMGTTNASKRVRNCSFLASKATVWIT